ncbi:MAG: zinc ABC transporter substrate-binding protein [Bacillota bacterium]|nr:zinc ABC transporter substrate-binding protein [Bacillota bacterium]
MKKIMILLLVLLVIASFFVKNNSDKIPAKTQVKNKEIKVLVNDKMINKIINNISTYPKTVDIMFNNVEQQNGYKLSENLKSNIKNYDAYIYNSKVSEPFANDIISLAGNIKLNQVCVTRGGTEVKSLEYLPFYYLNGDNLKIAILNIKNAVQDLDPKNRDAYEKNYNTYVKLINFYLAKGKEVGKELKGYVFIYPDERYKVFTDYYNLKSQSTKDYKESDKKGVFLYTDDSELKDNEMFIKLNNLETMKISLPCNDDVVNSLEKNLKYFRFLHGDIVL